MACQGCGRTSDTRLCCPTCIEYGRTSFFCGQECFTKNWNAHNQLHELMRRKQGGGAAEAGAAAAAEGGPSSASDGGGGSLGSRGGGGGFGGSAPSLSGGLAPLAGGTSIVNLSVQKRSAAAAAAAPPAAGSAGGGLLGSLASMLGGPGAALASRLGGKDPRSRSPPPRTEPPPAARRERSRSRDAGRGAQPVAKARQFNVQLSLWALIIVCITAGMLFYREHERYVSDAPPQAGELADAGAIVPPSPTTDGAAGAEVVAAVPAVLPAAAAAAAAGGAISELQSLRDMVERHEQMLRYIMDRYVEKKADAAPPPAGAAGAEIEAAKVNLSQPEFESKGFGEAVEEKVARGNAALRKRQGGGDAVGLPALER